MTHTHRSTLTIGIEAALAFTSLHLYIEAQATKSRRRARHFLQGTRDCVTDLPRSCGHNFLWDKIDDQVELNKISDYITGNRIWVNNRQVQHPNTILYTDGSKDEKGNTGVG
uniref:Uncharacterized protein n=1 Tax=Lepeophtheirus salmonis TaxID=72036 RepID=A0A0K2UQT5_LEPSM